MMNTKSYLKLLFIVIILLIASGAIWKYIDNRNKNIASDASGIYIKLMEANEKQQSDIVVTQATELVSNKKYAATPYSTLASLILAKFAVDAQDLDAAVKHLNVAIERSRDNLQYIARVRLARVFTAKTKYAQALEILANKVPEPFKIIYLVAQGDVYAASGDVANARDMYGQAENLSSSKMPLLDLKLSELSSRSDKND